MKPAPKTPDPELWGDTAEAMKATGAKDYNQLHYWHRDGFPAPDGLRLPLDRQRHGRRALWRRADFTAIGISRGKLRPAEDHELTPWRDENGILWQRHRRLLRDYKCNDSTARKWSKKCSLLDFAPFVRRKIPGKHHYRAEEWGYRDDLYQAALLRRTESLARRKEGGWLDDRERDEHGRLKPRPTVPANGSGHLSSAMARAPGGGPVTAPTETRAKERGSKVVGRAEKFRLETLNAWDRAKAAGVPQAKFCADAKLQIDTLKDFVRWRSMRSIREARRAAGGG